MSTRTIIEINHDYLADLEKPGALDQLLLALRHQSHIQPPNGVRVLAQRHHTEAITVKVA